MLKKILLLVFGVVAATEVCIADLADDAEDALNSLRQATSDNLNGGFSEHTKMSNEVDIVALNTKETGLKILKAQTELLKIKFPNNITGNKVDGIVKTAADDLNSCVDDQADQAIMLIYNKSLGLTDKTLQTIYDEEKKFLYCGRSDEDCLSAVIGEINETTAAVPNVINDEIELDRQAVEEQIELIKACATEAIHKVKNAWF